ncbi:hypothetical protein SS50377_28190 [Spironucleus salmonicida]|uniref:Uncharacterized protein n=1 Tax=Spironucleus salmonicida TaxID=348837 RepID=V6LNW7_9EUKA|nr:hypothetical protein SS50377_28190 [Spironucleus salmonicida]|eukprot:EST46367.1 Hypothetical protein SS50377_13610 [Spironucleus salmonicida]
MKSFQKSMYAPLVRFLESYGYDQRTQLSPLLLFKILQTTIPDDLPSPILIPSLTQNHQNQVILQNFLNSQSNDIGTLALSTFLYLQQRSIPHSLILRIMKTFGLDISNFNRYIRNGAFLNLIIATHPCTFKLNFDILLKTELEAKNRQNLKVSLPLLQSKFDNFLVKIDDFKSDIASKFVIYQVYLMQDSLGKFKDFYGVEIRFANQFILGETIQSDILIRKFVIAYGLCTEFANLTFDNDSLKIQTENNIFIVQQSEIVEIQAVELILILKCNHEKFQELRIGVKNDLDMQDLSQQMVKLANN